MTWTDLLNFINRLSEEQLQAPAVVQTPGTHQLVQFTGFEFDGLPKPYLTVD